MLDLFEHHVSRHICVLMKNTPSCAAVTALPIYVSERISAGYRPSNLNGGTLGLLFQGFRVRFPA